MLLTLSFKNPRYKLVGKKKHEDTFEVCLLTIIERNFVPVSYKHVISAEPEC